MNNALRQTVSISIILTGSVLYFVSTFQPAVVSTTVVTIVLLVGWILLASQFSNND